jgi:hypothetical protein
MKYKFLFLFFFFSLLIQGQVVLDTIAKETCSCLKSKDLDFKKEVDFSKIEMELGLCMIANLNLFSGNVTGLNQVDYSNSSELEKISGEIGAKMLNYCPDIMLKLSMTTTDHEENKSELVNAVSTNLLECALVEIKRDQFVSLIVKDTRNKLYTLLVLNYFETVFLLLENKIKEQDKLKVSYSEQELYDPLIKDFRNFKVLNFLEKM